RILQMGAFSGVKTLTCNGTIVPNFLSQPGYVSGNLKKTFSGNGSKTFEVGTPNAYSPVDVNVTAGTPADFTARANQGKLPANPGTHALSRYWTLTSPGSITADLTFHYKAADVVGTEANYKIIKSSGGTLTAFSPSVPIDTTNHTATLNGVTSFSDWTLGEATTVTSISRAIGTPTNAS